MSSIYGENIKVSIFGQSHSAAIGMSLDGVPAGLPVDEEKLQAFLDRRAPGSTDLGTPRKEADKAEILSGLVNGHTCGAPIAAMIPNTNTRAKDYSELKDKPRPGHADFTAQMKYGGYQDVSGGGHFSGRLTAPLCIAGGICLQLLEQQGIRIAAHILAAGDVQDRPFDPMGESADTLDALVQKPLTVLDPAAEDAMRQAILSAKADADSVGGIIECIVQGLPAGLGDPMFYGLENRIAQAVFAIPAVKGLEFGAGFAAAKMRGSQNNDAFCMEEGTVRTKTNNHGGILGGISTGMPILFRAAFKPTPSIGQEQNTVSLSQGCDATLTVQGRHDPCIVPRAVPCVEAAAALAIYDAYLRYRMER